MISSIEEFILKANELEKRVNEVDKTNKKNLMTINMLNEELEEKTEESKKLSTELADKTLWQEKGISAFIDIIDEFENIYKFASNSNNENLLSNIQSVMKTFKKRMEELNIEEIKTVGEIFNPELHECVYAVEDSSKKKYEIVETVKKGYTFNGKIVRIAKVIAVK